VLISPYPVQEGNKLPRQKILSFVYLIYNHNWRKISTIYIYNKTSIKQNILHHQKNTSGSRSSPCTYRGADKSLARPNSRCILFDGENISFDASLVIYINSTNILPIMILNRIYETQNLLSQ